MNEYEFYCYVDNHYIEQTIKAEALIKLEKQIIDAEIYLPSIKKLDEYRFDTPDGKVKTGVRISARKRTKDDDLKEQLEYLIEKIE